VIRQLVPYLNHIGDCSADNHDPLDTSCICGLRQVFHKTMINEDKMISITRYVQRVDEYGIEHGMSTANMDQAIELARSL